MKTKNKILIVKICALLIWAFAIIFPSIFKNMQTINYVDINLNEEMSEGDYFQFNVEFSDYVAEGDVTIEFYDADKNSVYLVTLPFESRNSKVAVISIDKESVPVEAERYDFIEANVQTPMAKTVNNIMYPLSIAMVVVVVFALRIRYREDYFGDDVVEIYSGVLNHTVKVNNGVVFRDKYLITMKMTTLTVDVNDTTAMNVTFRANNRIEVFVINKQDTNYVNKKVSEEFVESQTVKTEEISQESEPVQSEMIQTEKVEDTEKMQDEIEVSESQNKDEETK